MSSWTTNEVHCWRCGHSAGYHGAGYCEMRVGTEARPQCDCTGWLSAKPDDTETIATYLASEDAEEALAEALGPGEEWRQQARAILQAWRERLP